MLCVFGASATSAPAASTHPHESTSTALQALPVDTSTATQQSTNATVSLYVGPDAHMCSVLPHPEGPSALELEAQVLHGRAIAAARATSLRRRNSSPKRSRITCAKRRSEVAVIIAADIRLPPEVLPQQWVDTIAFRHRGGGQDGCQRDRAGVVAAINRFTKGSDVFIHTDAAYASDINLFEHVVASRFAEEDGGNPATANKGNRGGLYVQWWRLMRAV